MLISYLKITFRNLVKHKSFTAINITGLSIGIASFILIMMYVGYELSFEKFYSNYDKIHRVYLKYLEGETFEIGDAQTYFSSGPTLKEQFPEIKEYVRLCKVGEAGLIVDGKIVDDSKGYLADSNFFNVFDLEIKQGKKEEMLHGTNSIVLTESLEKKLFGDVSGINKIVTCYRGGEKIDLHVKGIITDVPENTSMKINYLISFDTGNGWISKNWWKPSWHYCNFFTFILLNNNVNVEVLSKKIENHHFKWDTERHAIEPLTDLHLYSDKPNEMEVNGSAKRIYFLLAIAITIIILSWLNYINLSVTKIIEHANETGIRKTIGANKRQLITQFLIDAIVLNLVSIFIASLLLLLALPLVTGLLNIQLSLMFVAKKYALFFILILIGALASGLYPAFVLSKLQLVKVLKGKFFADRTNIVLRKGLVILQFSITIILIASSVLVSKQLNYMKNLPIGVDMNKVFCISGDIYDSSEKIGSNLRVLKSELQRMSFIESVSLSETFPGEGHSYIRSSIGVNTPDGKHSDDGPFYFYEVDSDYIPILNMKFLAGGNFNSVKKKSIILNETACKFYKLGECSNLIGEKLGIWGNQYEIVGVIEDYHHFGLNKEQIPLFLFHEEVGGHNLLVKFNNNNQSLASLEQSINLVNQKWDQMFPQSTFSSFFIDTNFNKQYTSEQQFKVAFDLFSVIALLIACLGLLGIVNYIVVQRTKEIGVRKVNGAKVSEVLLALNKDFIIWILISFVIAIPVSLKIMNAWLNGFASKTSITWWIFALAGILALGIALLTVSWQSWRAATKNPVEALKYE